MADLNLLHLYLATPPSLATENQSHWAIAWRCLFSHVELRLVTDRRTDGHTDRQTDSHIMTAYTALASRGKNWQFSTLCHIPRGISGHFLNWIALCYVSKLVLVLSFLLFHV